MLELWSENLVEQIADQSEHATEGDQTEGCIEECLQGLQGFAVRRLVEEILDRRGTRSRWRSGVVVFVLNRWLWLCRFGGLLLVLLILCWRLRL